MRLIPLVLSLAVAAMGAQISGRIQYSVDHPLAGANVTVTNQETGVRRLAWTNAEGYYSVSGLQPGTYKLVARVDGFQTVARIGIRLEVDELARIDLTMQLGRFEQTVVVDSGSPFIDTENASVGTVFQRELLENVPLKGRGLLTLLEATPGVVVTPVLESADAGQFSVDGQRADANNLTIDGISANYGIGAYSTQQWLGGSLPALSAIGSMHSIVSTEALEEFRLETSGGRADLGRMTGGQLTLSTRAGTNHFHGSVFEFLRNGMLDANDWFANRSGQARPLMLFNDFGGSLGGPIRSNRTFFFASLESLRIRESTMNGGVLPDLATRQAAPPGMQSWLMALPLGQPYCCGTVLFTEMAPKRSSVDTASLRIDHTISSRLQFFSRYQHSPSFVHQSYFGGFQLDDFSTAGDSLTLGLDAALSRWAFARSRIGYSQMQAEVAAREEGAAASVDFLFWSPVPTPPADTSYNIVAGMGVSLPLSTRDQRNLQHQLSISQSAEFSRGSHLIQAGVDIRHLSPDLWTQPYTVFAQFPTLTALFNGQGVVGSVMRTGPADIRLHQLAAYGQDTWKISGQLTLYGGVRWEFNPPPSAADGLPVFTAATLADTVTYRTSSDGGALWPAGKGNWAPQSAIAWKPFAARNLVVRASAGLHYDLGIGPALMAEPLVTGGQIFMGGPTPTGWGWTPFGAPTAPQSGTGIASVVSPFRTPRMLEWNTTVEQAVGRGTVASVSYVGSSGHRLRTEEEAPDATTIVTNRGYSSYNALQATVRTRMSGGLVSSLSFSWAHSIDNASHSGGYEFSSFALAADDSVNRGNSDFDVRGSVLGVFSWQPPRFRGWSLSGIGRARAGFPFTVVGPVASVIGGLRPNLVIGQPIWIPDRNSPIGTSLNPLAFQTATGLANGSLGRNAIVGPGMSQLDLALQKELRFNERWALRIRLEAFNIRNTANFVNPDSQLTDTLFGRPTSMLNQYLGSGSPDSGLTPALQMGGPRSLQLGLRLHF